MTAATPERRPGAGWPVNLLVAGRTVVVVGAGRVAARKIDTLIDLGADVVVVAPEVGDEVRRRAGAGEVTLHERPFRARDLDDAWLAVAATDDPAVNREVRAAGDARRVFVNAADDPAHCSMTLLSTLRRGDVVVAVGTGGASPALARWLRERIEGIVGPEVDALAGLLAEVRREIMDAGGSTEDADWQRALDAGMLDLVRDGRITEAKELLRSCL